MDQENRVFYEINEVVLLREVQNVDCDPNIQMVVDPIGVV